MREFKVSVFFVREGGFEVGVIIKYLDNGGDVMVIVMMVVVVLCL